MKAEKRYPAFVNFLLFVFISFSGLFAMNKAAESEPGITAKQFSWKGNKVQLIIVQPGAKVLPVASRPGRSVVFWAKTTGALAAINGGYFNHSDGWPVSTVIVDGVKKTDPEKNAALLKNKALQ